MPGATSPHSPDSSKAKDIHLVLGKKQSDKILGRVVWLSGIGHGFQAAGYLLPLGLWVGLSIVLSEKIKSETNNTKKQNNVCATVRLFESVSLLALSGEISARLPPGAAPGIPWKRILDFVLFDVVVAKEIRLSEP